MFNRVFRTVFTLCGMLFGYGVADYLTSELAPQKGVTFTSFELLLFQGLVTFLFALIFYKLFTSLYRGGEKLANEFESNLEKIPAIELVAGSLGLIAGLTIAVLVSNIIRGFKLLQFFYLDTILSLLLYLLLGVAGVKVGRSLASGEARASLQSYFTRENTRGKNKQSGSLPKIFDTSVIIDGRIYEILKTGFLEGDIIIPEFVLVELRHISDSSDALKRNRGRRGLDILNKIQADYGIEIYSTDGDKAIEEIPEVDVKLIKLAQIMKGVVVTNDFNLNKVASISGVGVLNINELANTLKPAVLPGESMQVFVVKDGKEKTQGVGYLEDGTMIVVEGGSKHIGQTVETTVTSVLQTSAGRMIFTKAN